MDHESQKPVMARLVAFVMVCLVFASCTSQEKAASCLPEIPPLTKIKILGGAENAAYNNLIDAISDRAKKLREIVAPTDAKDCTDIPPECQTDPNNCHLLAGFEFAKDNGGSKKNLIALGMEKREDYSKLGYRDRVWKNTKNLASRLSIGLTSWINSPDSSCLEEKVDACDARYALVQNYFVYSAATEECSDGSTNGCDLRGTEDLLEEYEHFDDLRIVLPLYYGPIQFVTSNEATKPDKNGEQIPIDSLADLAGQPIYLGGGGSVNRVHGMEVLQRHPSLLGKMNVLEQNEALYKLFKETHFGKNGREYSDDEKKYIEMVFGDGYEYSDDEKRYVKKEFGGGEAPEPENKFKEQFDKDVNTFRARGMGQKALGNRLIACGIAKAYVISGEIIEPLKSIPNPDSCPDGKGSVAKLKQIPIPDIIIDGMVSERRYYHKVETSESQVELGLPTAMPAITTYLVTTAAVDKDEVQRLTKALDSDWQNLMLLHPVLEPLQENIYKKPAPYHAGAEDALADQNLMGKATLWTWILGGCLLLFFFAWKPEAKYDRLGEQEYGWKHELWQMAKDTSKVMAIFFGTLAVFALFLSLIRMWETSEATFQNTDDQLSRFAFFQALLWMFTFVSSGYENNVFPNSSLSRFFISMFAIFGIAAPLWAIVTVVDQLRERRLARARGGVYRGFIKRGWDSIWEKFGRGYRSNGMLLLCGWNSKAPGLIYTLTCPDSPYRGGISIVANIDEEYPIKHWGFNRRRVRFHRGDPSRRNILERAEARKSDYALILADENAGSDANSVGVLTALALRRLTKDVFISAEFALGEDHRKFSTMNVNEIINPRLQARRILAIACFGEGIVDFVLDTLSPDDHAEWYSVKTEKLNKQLFPSGQDCTVEDYSRILQQNEINVVGVCLEHRDEDGGVFSPNFAEHKHLDPLASIQSNSQVLPMESHIICAAVDPKAINKARSNLYSSDKDDVVFSSQAVSILPALPAAARILIIGYARQAEALGEYLSDFVRGTKTVVIATDTYDDKRLDDVISNKIRKKAWTHVIVLASMPDAHSSAEHAINAKKADTRAVLRTNLVRTVLNNMQSKAVVVAEVNNVHSRQMAEDADATTVVPTSLVTERIMARLMAGRGHVSEMISAMTALNDGKFLRSVRLPADHPLIGRRLQNALNTWFADGRVLGVLPVDPENPAKPDEGYRNKSGDFNAHFAMCCTWDEKDLVLKEHDLVIVMGYPPTESGP